VDLFEFLFLVIQINSFTSLQTFKIMENTENEKTHVRTARIFTVIAILAMLWVINYVKEKMPKNEVMVYCHNKGTPAKAHFKVEWSADLKIGKEVRNPNEPTGDLYIIEKIVPSN